MRSPASLSHRSTGQVDPKTVRAWLESGECVVIDVREPDEHARVLAAALDRRVGSRIGMTSGVMMAFIATMILIAQPSSADEGNAMVSIFFPFMYMAAGIWAGWRLFAIGLVTAIAIIVGYFWMREYFDIWMGVFGGGSLIAGGIWLRTA